MLFQYICFNSTSISIFNITGVIPTWNTAWKEISLWDYFFLITTWYSLNILTCVINKIDNKLRILFCKEIEYRYENPKFYIIAKFVYMEINRALKNIMKEK